MSDTPSAKTAAAAAGRTGAPGLVGDDAAVAVVSLFQAQKKIYPRAVSGLFATWRWGLVWFTQILFYGVPWLSWNGRQAVLFDLGERRFYIGPMVLHPQDFIYLTALLIISAYALFLFTAVAGRLWCGFACPQTVYTEMFMWVETRIEGDRIARMKLDAGPWTARRLWRKAAKHGVWLAIGLWTGFTFVGYFTPIHSLAAAAATLGFGPWEWFWVLFYGLATYGNAGFLREQVCKYMCPYARFQSVMFDRDTLVIGYDSTRGEPRGSRPRKADPSALGLGSCIDCGLCVQVCPTGIDIRNGLQYECIGCAACIDVCDSVMDKMNYPKGLIRYDTQDGIAQATGRSQWLGRLARPRVLAYSAVLLLILLAFFWSLATRSPFKVDVERDRAALARLVDNGQVENIFRLQIMNATERPQRFALAVGGLPGITLQAVPDVLLAPAQARWITLSVRLPADAASGAGPGAHPIHFDIGLLGSDSSSQPGTAAAVREQSSFVVPR